MTGGPEDGAPDVDVEQHEAEEPASAGAPGAGAPADVAEPTPEPDPAPGPTPQPAPPSPAEERAPTAPEDPQVQDVPPVAGPPEPWADTRIPAPAEPRFTPPPYDPAATATATAAVAVPPPAADPPVPEQYVTGAVPIVEIEGGWEAVHRRRRRQTLTFLAGLAAVIVLGFVACLTYAGVVPWPFGGTVTVSQSVCTRSQPLPPKRIAVRVFNGSSRNGLASTVSAQLKSLGFVVKATGNDPLETKLRTPVEIRHGENGDVAAATMSAYVLGKVRDVQDDRQDATVDLVLGPAFSRLKNKAEVKKSLAAVTSTLPLSCPLGVTPPPSATPTASTTPAAATPKPTARRKP